MERQGFHIIDSRIELNESSDRNGSIVRGQTTG